MKVSITAFPMKRSITERSTRRKLTECDLISGELEDRFNTHHLQLVLSMEQVLLKAANKHEFEPEVRKIEQSCFSKDFDFATLNRQLPLLHDII